MGYTTREEWLQAAADQLRPLLAERSGLTAPTVRIGVGWTSKGRRSAAIGECWKAAAAADGVNEITVRVTHNSDVLGVLGTLLHEMIHAALDCEDGHGGRFKRAHTAVGFRGSARTSAERTDELTADLQRIAATLGEYPGARGLAVAPASSAAAKQSTRMIKLLCHACGFTFRCTRQWIDAAGGGAMRCPDPLCDVGLSVEVAS